jgi:hypothetical protein
LWTLAAVLTAPRDHRASGATLAPYLAIACVDVMG